MECDIWICDILVWLKAHFKMRKIQHSFPQQLCNTCVRQLTQERSCAMFAGRLCLCVNCSPPAAQHCSAHTTTRSKDIWVTPKKRRERWWSKNHIKAAENAAAWICVQCFGEAYSESDLIWLEKCCARARRECYFRRPLSLYMCVGPMQIPNPHSLCVMQIRRLGLRVQQWWHAAGLSPPRPPDNHHLSPTSICICGFWWQNPQAAARLWTCAYSFTIKRTGWQK